MLSGSTGALGLPKISKRTMAFKNSKAIQNFCGGNGVWFFIVTECLVRDGRIGDQGINKFLND